VPVRELSLEDIREAHARIRGNVHRTPVLTSRRIDLLTGARLFFKCENLQKTGAFKARGALNAVLSLSPGELASGVATHSSGNHAAALSWAAALAGVTAHVVMPVTAPRIKVASVERLGGRITFCEPTLAAREAAAARIVRETGAVLVHPFNDPRVMAGQGTAALELLEDVPDLDAVVCPVGGGGLAAGTAVAARGLLPRIRVLGAEPEGAADAALSLRARARTPVERPESIADGLLALVGDLTFPVILREVEAIATVPEAEISAAVRSLLEVMKIVVEPSGAVGYAAVACGGLPVGGLRVGIILSGGNMDLERAPWLARAS
jgi:threonine dehydratase